MLGYTLVLLLGAVPAGAQVKREPRAEVRAPAVAVSTAALSAPELKRLRNSETAALRKKQAAEAGALTRSLAGRPRAEAGRAMKELRASHEKELAALKARHLGGGNEKKPPAPEKKP